MASDEILSMVAKRNANRAIEGPQMYVERAIWQLWLGKWLERNLDYLQHRPDCGAYHLNSKTCTCGIRELLLSIKTDGAWMPGMEYPLDDGET